MELISPASKVIGSSVVLLKEETNVVLVGHPLVLERVVTKEKLWLLPCSLAP